MDPKLTPDQLGDLKEAFAIYDLNSDGIISTREFSLVMRALGLNPTEAELLNFIHDIDTDKDGAINFEEFANFMVDKLKPMNREEDLIEAFKVFDIEGKGYIAAEELRRVMTNLGEKLTDVEVNEMVREADIDGDGVINYVDFVKMMTLK